MQDAHFLVVRSTKTSPILIGRGFPSTTFWLWLTVRHGKWPIEIDDFPIKTSIHKGKSPFLIGTPSISMGHLYHGKLLNNQRVILYRWLLEAPSRRLRIQRRSFLWRTLSESGAGYILNNLHWEYDIIWPINMGISNIKILLNGVIWQNINYFMILSTIYWSNMSQRMRLLPEMLIGTLLSAEDSTCFPLRPLGVSWVCPFCSGSPVFSSRPQRQDNSDVDDAGWQSALPGLGGLCASLLLPLHVRCERMWTKRGNRGELSWKGLADVVHVSKAVSIRQRPLIWHKHTQWIVDTSQVWSGNWSQLNKYIYIYIYIPITSPFHSQIPSFHSTNLF